MSDIIYDIYYWGRVLVIIIKGHHERTGGREWRSWSSARGRALALAGSWGTSGDERGRAG